MIPRWLPLALGVLALLSLILGGLAPPRWQALPAAGALVLLGLALLERRHSRKTRAHSPLIAPAARARLRANTPVHLLIASTGPAQPDGHESREQALGFWQALAASGNRLRLYGLDPELRLLAAATPIRPLMPVDLPQSASGATADLKAALARLCSQSQPGSVLVVVAPLEEAMMAWLSRLELAQRGLQLWLVDTALEEMTEPDEIRTWRDARRYAEAWQIRTQGERLAARLERRGIRWLPASATADLQTRLLQLWNADDPDQTAD